MQKPKIGLLPHYIKLYDESIPQLKESVGKFLELILSKLQEKGLEVISGNICRVEREYRETIEFFETQKVDAIVSLHLAYSPSLESIDTLLSTRLPIIVLDTTPKHSFNAEVDAEEILYNHGIHGVQDMCNLLVRNNKKFVIEAGHWEKSDVLERVVDWAKAASLASDFRNQKIGIYGRPFKGMGDFAVPEHILCEELGIEVTHCKEGMLEDIGKEISSEEIENEINDILEKFECKKYTNEILTQTAVSGLALRKWADKEKLTGFTINFLSVDGKSGLSNMPFIEICKAMERGLGYAGEGDILTAALMGALSGISKEVSFVEMFCPDWAGNSIFLSHMGEMNLKVASAKPMIEETEFPFTDIGRTIKVYGGFKAGKARIVNLALCANNRFKAITVPGEIIKKENIGNLRNNIHGWFKPEVKIDKMLEIYSREGGTHHSVLVYDSCEEQIYKFANIMGWDYVSIS